MVRGSNKYFNTHLGRVTLELNLKVKDYYQTHLETKKLAQIPFLRTMEISNKDKKADVVNFNFLNVLMYSFLIILLL